MPSFIERYPDLYHVTLKRSVPFIRQRGLVPAGVLKPPRASRPTPMRKTWEVTQLADGAEVYLRWQNISDEAFARRVPATIQPSQWRDFINSMVFFCLTMDDALAFAKHEKNKGYDQVALRFSSATLVTAGCQLRFCGYNSGFTDRKPDPSPRSFDDFRPIADWRPGQTVREVTVAASIPATVPFEEIE